MLRKRFDVALSLAAADLEIGEAIKAALKKRGIRCYLYSDHDNTGEHLMKLTLQYYLHAKLILLIRSENSSGAYWSDIEEQIAHAKRPIWGNSVLFLKVGNVKAIQPDKVYMVWKGNAEEIADSIITRLRIRRNWFIQMIMLAVMLIAGCFYAGYFVKPDGAIIKDGVFIPAQSFQLNKECATRTVKVPAFRINHTEVTVKEYRGFSDSTNRLMPDQPGWSTDDHPVVNVTWDDADAYCKWRKGRLPTEAEWMIAARTDKKDKYSGGSNASKVAARNYLQPVMKHGPNKYGLFDMTGNVAEWCADWYYSGCEAFTNAALKKGPNNEKVLRGGHYRNTVDELRVMCREKARRDSSSQYIGFRVAWDN